MIKPIMLSSGKHMCIYTHIHKHLCVCTHTQNFGYISGSPVWMDSYSPGVLVSLGIRHRTKWGWVLLKLVINLFKFSWDRNQDKHIYLSKCYFVAGGTTQPPKQTNKKPQKTKTECGSCQNTNPEHCWHGLEWGTLLLPTLLASPGVTWRQRDVSDAASRKHWWPS